MPILPPIIVLINLNSWAKSTKQVVLKIYPQNCGEKNLGVEVMQWAKMEKMKISPLWNYVPPIYFQNSEYTSLKQLF